MLRRGIRPWQLPAHESPSAPDPVRFDEGPRTTVWQFARSARFTTVHVDAWSSYYGPYHDGQTLVERDFIDRTITFDDVVPYQRDREAARSLASILNGTEPAFVVVDKIGAHFPYDSWSAPDFNRFHRADGARFEYARNTREDRIGSYENALAWSVDGFFRELLGHADLRGALVVYTSDHGQDFDRPQAHCSVSNTQASEAWVPLFALADDKDFGHALAASAKASYGKATHFDIFPTLLIAMGYDARWVTDTYGPSLLDIPSNRPRRFMIGDVWVPGWRKWVDAGP